MKQTRWGWARARRYSALPTTAVIAAVLIATGCSSSNRAASRTSGGTVAPAPPSGGGAPSSTTTSANGAKACPTGTVSGATATQVTVAASVISISGGSLSNATVGVPSVEDQESDWNLVAEEINKSGGAGCRALVMRFYNVNPIDAAAAQQACLDIAATHPFLVVDSGALVDVGASNCIPAHKIPLVSSYLSQDQLTNYYPFYLDPGGFPNDAVRNGILGLNQLGYFSAAKGFRKLGLLYHTCGAGALDLDRGALDQAGVAGNAIVPFNLGCPAGQVDTPASMEQAVLTFKSAGVSDVTELGVNDWGIFTRVASQQNFRPAYVLNDSAAPAVPSTGQNAPDPGNLDGAVDVVGGGYGEQTTPGYTPSGGTARCNAIFSTAGKASVYQQPDGYGGVVCGYLWFVQAVLDHAQQLQGAALAAAVHSIGTIEFSYPFGPVNFSAAPSGAVYGVSYWRAVYYHASCKCWQVPDPTFHEPFK